MILRAVFMGISFERCWNMRGNIRHFPGEHLLAGAPANSGTNETTCSTNHPVRSGMLRDQRSTPQSKDPDRSTGLSEESRAVAEHAVSPAPILCSSRTIPVLKV